MQSFITNANSGRAASVTAGVLFAASFLAIALRLGAWIPNVTAVGALALYSGGRLKWWSAWVPAIGVMAATDYILHLRGIPSFYGAVYACFLLDVLLGVALARNLSPVRVGVAGFLGALQFYLITNFAEWLAPSNPAALQYPQTAEGLLTCYVMALPFFGYTLLGNLAFAALFFGGEALLAPSAAPASAAAEATETA